MLIHSLPPPGSSVTLWAKLTGGAGVTLPQKGEAKEDRQDTKVRCSFAPPSMQNQGNLKRFSPRFSSTFNPFRPIVRHFQSLSVSFNQLQSILVSFNQFDSVKTQEFIYNRTVGKTRN